MQITFRQYFKAFNEWLCPIYWVSGEGDGRLDIEQRLIKATKHSDLMVRRLVCKKKEELIQIKDHFRSQDLFNDTPLLVVSITGALSLELIQLIETLSLKDNDKLIIWSPKLTPKAKNHAIWSKPLVAHYALWPYSPEQALTWWQNRCRELNLKPSQAVTQSVLAQTGHRIDELMQIASVWQLQYPQGGEVNDIPPGAYQLSERVYDEAFEWLMGVKAKPDFDVETNMPFYFALKQTIDELVQYAYLQSIGKSPNEMMKQLGWWPQKLNNIQSIARRIPLAEALNLTWTLSQIEMARFGASSHTFKTLVDCFYHRQSLPLTSISQ